MMQGQAALMAHLQTDGGNTKVAMMQADGGHAEVAMMHGQAVLTALLHCQCLKLLIGGVSQPQMAIIQNLTITKFGLIGNSLT